jgi:hypothetical protein
MPTKEALPGGRHYISYFDIDKSKSKYCLFSDNMLTKNTTVSSSKLLGERAKGKNFFCQVSRRSTSYI